MEGSNEVNSSMAFISRSNCEHTVSGREAKNSSKTSFGSTGEVGGVEKGFEWVDDCDGVDEPLQRLEGITTLVPSVDPEDRGRLLAGDIGGVCVDCESCCKMFKDATSPVKEADDVKLSVFD